jgi:hypothetical protein
MSRRKKIARRSQGALEDMHVMYFSRNGLVLEHPLPIRTTVNGQYYCAPLQHNVRQDLRCKQPELPERGVILLHDNAAPHRQRDVQNLVQHWGW